MADLHDLTTDELLAMRAAGRDIVECYRVLAKGGLNIVGEVLCGQGEFIELNHFPDDDAFDGDTQSQYYYHAHRGLDGEHGHFHTFIRTPGMPEGMQPVEHKNASEPWPQGGEALSHLIAISMDAYGFPIGLFTTNRWVTAEAWYAAEDVTQLLARFRVDHAAPSWPVNRWISAMFVLFRPQMHQLLLQRDAALAQWAARHPGVDVFEDRALDVTSSVAISVDEQMRQVQALLAQRSPRHEIQGVLP